MNKRVVTPRERTGVALVISVGILALLAVIATGFAMNMQFELKATSNYCDSVKAQNAAEAGIGLAIARLRNLACTTLTPYTAPNNDWQYTNPAQPSFDTFNGNAPANSTSASFLNLGRGNIGTCSLQVVDTASQININDANPNLGNMLNSLVGILDLPLTLPDAAAIVAGRTTIGGTYGTKEQIVPYLVGSTVLKWQKYNAIKDFITTNSYIDQYSEGTQVPALGNNWSSAIQAKAPININTARSEVLQSVLRSLISNQKAESLAGAIITQRATIPFGMWNGLASAGGFDNFIDNVDLTVAIPPAPALTLAERADIKNNANPNRPKADSGGTALPYTTDFCFHPSGIYEITSTGRVGIDVNGNGTLADAGDIVRSEKSITALVKIYDILCQTRKEQFRGAGVPYISTYQWVTWMDGCPVNSASLFGQYAITSPQYVTGALKIGFWENLDEDWAYTAAELIGNTSLLGYMEGSNCMLYGNNAWPKFRLADTNKWSCRNFSLRVFEYDYQTPGPGAEMRYVGQILFRVDWAKPKPELVAFHSRSGILNWSGQPCQEDPAQPGSGIMILTSVPPYYIYPPGIRMFVLVPVPPYPENYDQDFYRTLVAYDTRKVLNLRANGAEVTLWSHTSSGNSEFITRSNAADQPGTFALYTQNSITAWDDIRIIPPAGNYRSFFLTPTIIPPATTVTWGTMSYTAAAAPAQPDTTVAVSLNFAGAGGTFNAAANNSRIMNGPSNAVSNSMQYRVDFTSGYPFQNTPYFEDITITYLNRTKILYCR